MFTGIIEEVGTVTAAGDGTRHRSQEVLLGHEPRRLHRRQRRRPDRRSTSMRTASSPTSCRRPTAAAISANLKPGDLVNLERSPQLAGRVSGHLVRGVVEGTGTLDSFTPEGDAIIARFNAPAELLRLHDRQGPRRHRWHQPHRRRQRRRNLLRLARPVHAGDTRTSSRRKPGDRINLETDIIARYVEQMLDDRRESGVV